MVASMAITADREPRAPSGYMLFGAAADLRARSSSRFPAGLVLYWITTNVWTIGQQYVVKTFCPPPAADAEEVKATRPPPPPPRKKKKRR